MLKNPDQQEAGVQSSKHPPLHHQQSEEEDHPSTTNPCVSYSSWAMSPRSSNVAEEQQQGKENERPPRPPSPQKKSKNKEVVSPSFRNSSLRNSFCGNSMDNSSVAMEESQSAMSGMYSEATGFHSETTQVIRNTSGGVPLPPSAIIPTQQGLLQIQNLPKPSLAFIPTCNTTCPIPPESHDTLPEYQQYHQQPEKEEPKQKARRPSVCRGTQGWIIGLLVALFVFGLITVVVSFVLSKKNNATTEIDSIVGANDDGVFDDAPLFSDPNSIGSLPTESMSPSNSPSTAPTARPSFLDESTALFANAVEELLDGPRPSSHPSSPPSIVLATSTLPTAAPSKPPSTSPSPTTMSTSPTPSSPTPLLHSEATLTQQAQLWGQNNGDAAGSATALSANGRILLMASPNADNPANGKQRTGQVQVYERDNTANNNESWFLRATLQGQEDQTQLGFALATNHDGSLLAVSEPTAERRRGRVTIYQWNTTGLQIYEAQQILRGTDTADHFGISISLSDDNLRLAVGSPYHSTTAALNLQGQVQIYEYSGQEWQPMNTEDVGSDTMLLGTASLDWFGWSVSLSQDGQVLAVGAPRNTEFGGYVQCFRFTDKWISMGPPILNVIPPLKLDDRFGHSTAITNTASRADGSSVTRVAVGAPWKDVGNALNSGMVAVFEWSEDTFTWSLDDGTALGSVLIEKEPGFYHQFGYSLAMAGDVIAVGVPGWDNRRGMVNLFWLPHAFDDAQINEDFFYYGNEPWNQLANPLTGATAGDDFGFSVSLILHHDDMTLQEAPSSVLVASGAIMVSTTAAESSTAGYSNVYQTGTFS